VPSERISRDVIIAVTAFALISAAMHLFTNIFAGYEIFRDELYYIACSKRLDAGYVDHPPFSIYMLYLSRMLFGESLFAIRLFPSLFSGLTVFFTGLLTYRLGGSLFAIAAACTAVIFAPIFIAMHSVYSMNQYDYFFWITAVYILRTSDTG
jgi:4-amino-4-deoxy-L-arabinose transferase-like glycosyltransferase